MRRGNRKGRPAGERVPPGRGPPSGNPPQGQGEEGGPPRARKEAELYSAVLREEVGAVVQAFLRVGGAQRAGGEDGARETQRETLVPSRRGSPRPPCARRPRRPHRAPWARRREHPPSWLLRGESQRRRVPHRGPQGAGGGGGGCRRAGLEQLRPAPLPLRPPRLSLPDAGGRGLRARKKGSVPSAQRWRSLAERAPKPRRTCLETARGWPVQTQEGPKATRGAVHSLFLRAEAKTKQVPSGATRKLLVFVVPHDN